MLYPNSEIYGLWVKGLNIVHRTTEQNKIGYFLRIYIYLQINKYIKTRIKSFDARNNSMDCIQTRTWLSLQYKSTCTYIKPEEWLYSETFRAGDGGGGHYIVSLPTESNYTTSLSNSTALV